MKSCLGLPITVVAAATVLSCGRGVRTDTASQQVKKSSVPVTPAQKATSVFVKIPEALMPLDRGSKYEDPLEQGLARAHLGTVTGGGTQLSLPDRNGKQSIESVGIDIDLYDLEKGLPFLASELQRLGAPRGTVLEFEQNGKTRTIEIYQVITTGV